MDSPIRKKAHEMKGLALLTDSFHRFFQHRILRQVSLADLLIDSCKVLIHDPAAADIQVTHFRIPHLSFREADCQS